MASRNRWLLPEGIEEVLPERARRLERLRRGLIDLYSSWGYELLMPPLLEYLDSLLTGIGRALDLETFKLTDQLSGRLMGLRADITPQAARIDAHLLRREGATRLCYIGDVLHTRPEGPAGNRSPLQVGVEIYGHAGPESDVEVLCLMLETLALCEVPRLHLDLGHVAVYRALAAAAGLAGETGRDLFDALQRKARAEIEALLDGRRIEPAARARLGALVDLNGGIEVLEEARERLRGAGAQVDAALDGLEAIAQTMARRMPGLPLHFDLAELRGYEYQTGVVFAAFVPDHGREIARGGRYDAIGEAFGRGRPATGFSADLKTLADLSEAPYQPGPGGVLAPWSDEAELLEAVRALRGAGERVVQALPGQAEGELDCDRILKRRDRAWVVEPRAPGTEDRDDG